MPRATFPRRLRKLPASIARTEIHVTRGQCQRLSDAVGFLVPPRPATWSAATLPQADRHAPDAASLLRFEVYAHVREWDDAAILYRAAPTSGAFALATEGLDDAARQLQTLLLDVDGTVLIRLALRHNYVATRLLQELERLQAICRAERRATPATRRRSSPKRFWLEGVSALFGYLLQFGASPAQRCAARRLAFVRTVAEIAGVDLPSDEKDLVRLLPTWEVPRLTAYQRELVAALRARPSRSAPEK